MGHRRWRPRAARAPSAPCRKQTRRPSPSSWRSRRTTRRRSAIASKTRATMRARCARRSPIEMWEAINGAGWSGGLRQRAELARGVRALPALGAEVVAALRGLGQPDHAAQRRLLVHAARRRHRTRRQHRAHARREIPSALAGRRAGGRALDYFQWTTILRSVSALTAYHWVYRESLKPG